MRPDPLSEAYRELGVRPGDSAEQIRQAYLELVRRFHPDRAPDGKQAEYEERMKRINTAYETLSDPNRRAVSERLNATNGTTPVSTPAQPPTPPNPRDPYYQMRSGYQRRLHRVQVTQRALPPWARIVSGMVAGLGAVAGFILGLPFGIIGCIPGAMVGLVAGLILGLFAVYLCALGLPILILGWLGWVLVGEAGMVVGGTLGLIIGALWAYRLWRRSIRYTQRRW